MSGMASLVVALVVAVVIIFFLFHIIRRNQRKQVNPKLPRIKTYSAEQLACVPETFVAIDTKTTGLSEHEDLITEIAAVRFTADGDHINTDASVWFINIDKLISETGTKHTSFDNKQVKKHGQPEKEVIKEFLDFVRDAPLLVAYNAPFDLKFLQAACDRHGLSHTFENTECALAKSHKAWPGKSGYKLSDVAQRQGLDTGREHSALAYATITGQVFIEASLVLNSPDAVSQAEVSPATVVTFTGQVF